MALRDSDKVAIASAASVTTKGLHITAVLKNHGTFKIFVNVEEQL